MICVKLGDMLDDDNIDLHELNTHPLLIRIALTGLQLLLSCLQAAVQAALAGSSLGRSSYPVQICLKNQDFMS